MRAEYPCAKCSFENSRENKMITARFTMILGVMVMALGMYSVANTQQSQELVREIKSVAKENHRLTEDYKKLKLEESTLITEALLDESSREQLGMVVPESSAIVYVIEAPAMGNVAARNAQEAEQYSMRN